MPWARSQSPGYTTHTFKTQQVTVNKKLTLPGRGKDEKMRAKGKDSLDLAKEGWRLKKRK